MSTTPRPFAAALLSVAALTAMLVSPSAGSAAPSPNRHRSGIEMVGLGSYQARASTEASARAFDQALRAARENPFEFGLPWIDGADRLVQRQTRPRGVAGAQTTVRTYAQLEGIRQEVTGLGRAGVPDAKLIWRVEPDDEHNRMIITISRVSERLMATLAARFGTEAIAVRVDSHVRSAKKISDRQHPNYPVASGSSYRAPDLDGEAMWCTLGFPWTTGYVTAGHCVPKGGTSRTPDGSVLGDTVPGVDENYGDNGTEPFPGQSQNLGDLGLIRAPNPLNVQGAIYVGDKWSSTTRIVGDAWPRLPQPGDQYCTGGARSGELCGWAVTVTRCSYMSGGLFEWVNNVTEGDRLGDGVISGDSGGPVYTVRPDGKVVAKGITSGAGEDGNRKWHYFTPIQDALANFGGYLKVGNQVYEASSGNSWNNLPVIGYNGRVTGSQIAATQVNGEKLIYTLDNGQVYEASSSYSWRNLSPGITGASALAVTTIGTTKYIYTVINGQVWEASSANSWKNQPTGIPAGSALAALSISGTKYVYTVRNGQVYEASSANSWISLPSGIPADSRLAVLAVGSTKYVYTVIDGRVHEASSANSWIPIPTPSIGDASALGATAVGSTKYLYTILDGDVYEASSGNSWINLPTGIRGAGSIAATSVGNAKLLYNR